MDLVDGLSAFVATVQTGSFTGAAERLGVSNRLTSKYVAELEARLGVRLLQRTTRRLGLTPAGERVMAWAPALIEDLEARLAEVTEESRGFTGTIRISAPVTFGEMRVQDLLRRFAAPHPGLRIDLRLSDAYVDLASEGIDLAFRIGAPPATAIVARKLGEIRSLVVAAPAYLARHGQPAQPADLAGHACIVDSNRRDGARWRFRGPDGAEVAVSVAGRFTVNSARVARDLAVAGEGIAAAPDFVLTGDLDAGRLVPLLSGWEAPPIPLSAVWLEGAMLPRKLRALVDFAQADWRAETAERPAPA